MKKFMILLAVSAAMMMAACGDKNTPVVVDPAAMKKGCEAAGGTWDASATPPCTSAEAPIIVEQTDCSKGTDEDSCTAVSATDCTWGPAAGTDAGDTCNPNCANFSSNAFGIGGNKAGCDALMGCGWFDGSATVLGSGTCCVGTPVEGDDGKMMCPEL